MGKIYASLESATPANPAAGKSIIYPKAGGWFYRNETGAEVQWLDTNVLPIVANTYLRRNAGNTAFDAKTPQQVADELSPLQKFGPRNYIIGGDFSTNPWQRGTSFAGLTSGGYFADRFIVAIAASGTWTVSKVADAPTFAQAGRHITHCLEALVTTADAAVAATDYVSVYQSVEGYNYMPLYTKPQLIGFWAKSNLVGDYGVALRSSTGDRSFVSKMTINVANTWEYKTVQIPTAPVGGTWNFTNGSGILIDIALVCGATYQTATLNAWQSANVFAPSTQVNLAAAVNNYIRIADVKLIEGLVDLTPYQPAEEEVLTACQRYYEIHAESQSFAFACPSTGGYAHSFQMYWKVKKRAAPTVSYTVASSTNMSSANAQVSTPDSFSLQVVGTGLANVTANITNLIANAEL